MTEAYYETPFGYSLHYRLDGTGDEKILLVLGFSSCRQYWGPLVDAIHTQYPGRYTTCIYDQRGVGKSTTRALEKCSSTTIARDVLGLLLHLGWIGKRIPLHLISWSMGGFGSIEFVNLLLREVNSTLNLSSLTLCNTGHKFSVPPARSLIPGLRALGKGILCLLFGIPTKWFIPEILFVHYSKSYLSDPKVYEQLRKEYETRSPFNAPMSHTAIALFQHMYAVLTHYVPTKRMEAIKNCGLPIHVVVSSEDSLIHPTASITLARKLNCQFSYLPGGHMSHVEHTEVVLDKLVEIWDQGLSRKYPHFRKFSHTTAFHRTKSHVGNGLGTTGLNPPQQIGPGPTYPTFRHSASTPARDDGWAFSEPETIEKLNKLVLSRIDRWDLKLMLNRLKQPGRLLIGPALILPLIVVQFRKICNKSQSPKTRAFELLFLLYIIALLLVVQEVTRDNG